jgi:hypothetical protein
MDPLTRDAAWQQAVVTAAAALQRQYPGARLRQAQDLVLARAVLVSPDGVATVRSGTQAYHVHPQGGCTCLDSQHRTPQCKHVLAVELYRRVMLPDQPLPLPAPPASPDAAMPTAPAEAEALPATPPAPQWHVTEAPAACTLKFQLGGLDILYTMRDASDAALFARLRRILPRLQTKVTASQGTDAAPSEATPRCSTHQVHLKRYRKGDRVWWSHKLANGTWCKGDTP